jgi:hypothetical protein
MGLKDDVTKVLDKVKDAVENVKDAVSEGNSSSYRGGRAAETRGGWRRDDYR